MIELQYATIPVRVASTAVVNQQCLTATISGTPPPGAGPFNDDVTDNEQTLCLREPVDPFSTGQVDAFTIYPCVGISDPPCDNPDDIKVRDATTSHSTPLSSNSAVFRIDPLTSRTYDGHPNPSKVLQSVNDGNIVSWQTAVNPSSNYTGGVDSGVELYYSRTPYIGTTGWAGLTFGIAARDEHGNTPPPGKVFVRSASSGNEIRQAESPNYQDLRTASTSPSTPTSRLNCFLEFEKLGTYRSTWHAYANRSTRHGSENCNPDTNDVNQTFCASETYTFHVRPVTDRAIAS